jgi:hypothetical protein
MVLPSFLFPAKLILLGCGSGGGENLSGEESSPPDSNPFSDAEFGKNAAKLSSQFDRKCRSRLRVPETRQLFIRPHDESLCVVAVRVNNPDRFPVGINR